jgi:hypothetical protein
METVMNRIALESVSKPPEFVKVSDLFEIIDGKSVYVGTLCRSQDGVYSDVSELPSNAKLILA